jgi:hypothetical protein
MLGLQESSAKCWDGSEAVKLNIQQGYGDAVNHRFRICEGQASTNMHIVITAPTNMQN